MYSHSRTYKNYQHRLANNTGSCQIYDWYGNHWPKFNLFT